MKAIMIGPAWLLLVAASAAAAGQAATTPEEWQLPLDSLDRGTPWVSEREPTSLLALDSSSVRVSRIDEVRKAATKEAQAKVTPHQSWLALFTFAFVLKALCMFTSFLGQVSPIPQVMRFNKVGNTGDIDAAPFMSMLYGGFQWTLYGFFAFIVTGRSGFLVLVYSNVFAATLGFCYVFGFHRNCKNKESLRRLFIYYKIAAFFFSMQLLAILFLEVQNALFFCGLLSSICQMVGACSLLTTMPEVLRTKCSSSINLPLLYCGLISGTLWMLCGIMLHDPWLIGPNFIGLLFLCCAFAAVLVYPSNSNEMISKKEAMDKDKDLESRKSQPPPVVDANIWGRRMLVSSWRDEQKLSYGSASQLGETGGT